MNKAEIENHRRLLIELNKEKDKTIKELQKRNKNLIDDFKRHIDRIYELTERIDKAIEYLKQEAFLDYEQINELLEILGGEEQWHVKEEKAKEEDK